MSKTLVLLLAGSGTRMNIKENKALIKIGEVPLFKYSLDAFEEIGFDKYILVIKSTEKNIIEEYINLDDDKYVLVIGGSTRDESVRNAVKEVNTDYVFIHDAARPFIIKEDILNLIESTNNHLVGTMWHEIVDTIRDKNTNQTIDRSNLLGISTPQYFHSSLYNKILNNKDVITDEVSLFTDLDIAYIKETLPNKKITTSDDLAYLKGRMNNDSKYFIGHSLDFHKFSSSGHLLLGGVEFNDYPRLDGHSDADVVYHAVAESILGALGLGDLGDFFPDNDPNTLGIKSEYILNEVMNKLNNKGFTVHNLDVMIYLVRPKLSGYKGLMIDNLKKITKCEHICIKAATLNKLDLLKDNGGIGAEATVLIKKINRN